MTFKPLLCCFIVLALVACKQESHLYKIEGQQLLISDSLGSNQEIEAFIKPYREHVFKDLDSVLSYAVDTYTKTNGEFNTAIGNLMADAVYEESNPIFNKRTGKNIDMVLLNHGGIRSIISKGNVTTKTAFEIMPFENSVVVVALKGTQVNALVNYLAKAKRAHPIVGLQLVLDKTYNVKSALVRGKPIESETVYYVATNDYLYNGGDHMDFFKTNDSLYVLDYKIRKVLIDYFIKKDTLNPVIDDRFIQLK
ncbi:5'-nucleotidase-like protein [Flavobacteriaceae bacterium MAR_2010_72]|nr:5'-nucleotidase-like protein [Flavobacteriaceae bacterium MAR_2010_72]TVZ59424.1 5'-nucleotidase-like protein [Flavobacteriaceae bacterium MAR_2010_105]